VGVTGTAGGAAADPFPPPRPNTSLSWEFSEVNAPWASNGNDSLNLLDTYGGSTVKTIGTDQRMGYFGSGTIRGTTGDTSVGETAGDWTAHLWIYVVSHQQFGGMFCKNYNTGITWSPPAYSVFFIAFTNNAINDGVWRVGVWDGAQKTTGDLSLNLKEWNHLAAVWDGSNVTAYKNGVSQGVVAGSPGAVNWGNHGGWFVGGYPPAGNNVQCYIPMVRFEHEALSASDLLAIYNQGAQYL
jgi:hypothetical protein